MVTSAERHRVHVLLEGQSRGRRRDQPRDVQQLAGDLAAEITRRAAGRIQCAAAGTDERVTRHPGGWQDEPTPPRLVHVAGLDRCPALALRAHVLLESSCRYTLPRG